jgi:hypothetical protein
VDSQERPKKPWKRANSTDILYHGNQMVDCLLVVKACSQELEDGCVHTLGRFMSEATLSVC